MKYLVISLILLLSSCEPQSRGMVPEAETYDSYGEASTDEAAIPAVALMADVSSYLGQTVKIESEIVEVCQFKGCWLTLDTGTGYPIRVEVPRTEAGEYVYTVPKDIGRRRAIVSGTLVEKHLSDSERSHYAEDAGDASALPPPIILQITATGMLIEKHLSTS